MLKLETQLIAGKRISEELGITILEKDRKIALLTKNLRDSEVSAAEGIKRQRDKKKLAKENASKMTENLTRLNTRNEKTKAKIAR